MENILTKEFSTICKWFGDNKLAIDFREDKKSAFSFSKIKLFSKLNKTYTNYNIKQCRTA